MRANDSNNQTIDQMRETVRVLSQKVNLIERMLDRKEIKEAKVESGDVYDRTTRLSMNNGMLSSEWRKTDVTGTGDNADMSYSDWAFGFSVSGNVVTMTTGEVRHGSRPPVTAFVAGSGITINADQTWIYCTYTFGGTSAQVVSSVIEPVTTATTLNYPLHLWGVSNGVVSVKKIIHLGDIVIPGVFA
jgi:hypothetical protein